ncbi:hypothetical protein [Paraburkholderia ultramafica]|uniref:hypothetical protein n=1 Tax=Paraburkholderia ultramafica TaxID=1544867 RepID=UPI001FEA21E4|nr:hypothetical protein [Paraburkholderia ultramafica]
MEEIEKDFADLVASRLPVWIAREKFELLWDETNLVAARLVFTTEGESYISLLKRMHETFESRYAEVPAETTLAGQRS